MTSAAGNAQAREITRYSLVASEDEVLLPPGCRFKVESVLPQGDLTLIQLRELPSKEWIFDISKGAASPEPQAGLGAPPAMAAPLPQAAAAVSPSPPSLALFDPLPAALLL